MTLIIKKLFRRKNEHKIMNIKKQVKKYKSGNLKKFKKKK